MASGSAEAGLAMLRTELAVPSGFADGVLEAADRVAGRGPRHAKREDATGLPLIAIDPPGATDLDQALHIEPQGAGHVAWYAIADVAAFVDAGDAIDVESRARGVTLYLPDGRSPLHPEALSEGAASLLPGMERPSLLWRFQLGADGEVIDASVRRALVRVAQAIDYSDAARRIESGSDRSLLGLRTVGRQRLELEAARGGVSLGLPDQSVEYSPEHGYTLTYRSNLDVEHWNAQLSLMTGMTAGSWMIDAGFGPLRTLPAPSEEFLDEMARSADALGVPWEGGYAAAVRALDPSVPTHAALMTQSARGLRGAGYQLVGSAAPSELRHAAVASHYSHVTALLGRLIDRFGLEIAVSQFEGAAVPDWVISAIEGLPEAMSVAGRRASKIDNAVVDLMEALILEHSVGELFVGTVVDASERRGKVQIEHPAVVAQVDGVVELGTRVQLRLEEADPITRRVRFSAQT